MSVVEERFRLQYFVKLFYCLFLIVTMANKLKPQEIYELLDGYNSELDTLDDSDDEQVPNELHKMNEEGTM